MSFNSINSLNQSENWSPSLTLVLSSHWCQLIAQIVLSRMRIGTIDGAKRPKRSTTNAKKLLVVWSHWALLCQLRDKFPECNCPQSIECPEGMKFEAVLWSFCYWPLIGLHPERFRRQDHFIVANPIHQVEPFQFRSSSYIFVYLHCFFHSGHHFREVVHVKNPFESLCSYRWLSLLSTPAQSRAWLAHVRLLLAPKIFHVSSWTPMFSNLFVSNEIL